MGVSQSKIEEDKALQLCRERKKFVRQALDGRCSLASAHVAYIQSLKNTGTALWKFVEPAGHPVESSLYTSDSATGQLALTEKSLSQFSFSSPSQSQRVYATDTFFPSPSPPPLSNRVHTNHMKFSGTSSRKVLEKPSIHVVHAVSSSNTPQSTTPRSSEIPEEASPFEDPPWDYFGLSHSDDHQFSDQKSSDDVRYPREEERIHEFEGEDMDFIPRMEEFQESDDDEFDEPPTETLVRSFKNLNRESDHVAESVTSESVASESVTSETELLNEEKNNSPNLSPLQAKSSVTAPIDLKRTTPEKDVSNENKVAPKDLFSSIKDIEYLFSRASESGKEVPRMLEANKFHFRPIHPGKEDQWMSPTFLKACFSCGDDPSHVPEEPVQTDVRYLTWHRTTSSRSSSSRNPLASDLRDDTGGSTNDFFDNYCMVSGSHASTLDRLFAWEKKLYDEIKASEQIRRVYDIKCKALRQLESKGEASLNIDKTRAVVKDLHSRIRVSIHRIDSISKRIEELRDKELQPQLEELIQGLCRMWEVMLECHKFQFNIISTAFYNGNPKISMNSESHRQYTIQLENELSFLSSCFTKWNGAQRSYLQAIDGWLSKCVSLPKRNSRRKRRDEGSAWRKCGPPIYVTCGNWLQSLDTLPSKEVTDSIKALAAETNRFLPRQEKNHQGKKSLNKSESSVNILVDEEASEVNWDSEFDRFQSSLAVFLGRLNKFAESSMEMYKKLEEDIKDSKRKYDQMKSHVK